MHIQVEAKPTFGKIFISLGCFYLEMFFPALGKTIVESGRPYILDEYKVLAT